MFVSLTSWQAHLARIKFYRNTVFAHIKSTGVSDDDFVIYWGEISRSLVRLGGNAGEITKLMTSPLNEDYYLNLIKTQKGIVTINVVALLLSAVIFASLAIFLPGYFDKEPDYSYHQNFSISGFVGREWVFRQMEEEILNRSYTHGVLLVAEPGWGKSTIMKRLISSSSSSPIIHENIIGHHICKFNDKSTRDGGRFVKNLVQLIGKKIPKYIKIINSNQLVRDILKSNYNDNPVECFQTAIVEPLQNLDSAERNKSFILIDALDECLEKEESHQSIIVNMLVKKVPDLPNWVKLIVTSRNQPMTTSKILKNVRLSNLTIGVDNKRNEEDLDLYAHRTLRNFINETSPSGEIIRIQHLINRALYISKGNFLFLKTIIKNWQKYPDKMNAQSIPESLEDLYATFFTERFEKKHLERFEPFLEILLATSSPLTLLQLEKSLEHHFGQNYNTREVANSLSEYFKADVDKSQKPLEFHHQFFAEWLVNQTEGFNGIYIDKSRGHHYIADYLLTFYDERKTNLTFEELSELCAHFLHGKPAWNLKRLGSLKVSEIRDLRNKSILHDLASKRDTTELLAEFVKQFDSVDILDFSSWTPAMYAVLAGNYKNVKLFIDNQAILNYTVEQKSCFLWYLKHGITDLEFPYTLIFIAAYRGHFDIINLLIQRGANIEIASRCGWKHLHLATMIGNFEIANFFINKGAQPDVISLHHAAAGNHTEIVRLFLDTGVRDECLPCESENESWCSTNINRLHLCMCETALHAAVSRNNLEMAKLILQYGTASVNCRHGSGRTALMQAFSRKNIQMVELLINGGADINAECKSPLIKLMYKCYDEFDPLYIRYCAQPVCDGNRVIDFSFAIGLWKVMTPFISKGKLNISSDNARWNPATVAVIYDQVDFINATYGYRIKSIPNIETVLRYVALCHSVKTLEHLLYSEDVSKFTTVYEDGKTLLHFAILGSLKIQTKVYKTQLCPSSWCICPTMIFMGMVDEKRLATVMVLTKVLMSDINKQDKYGRTALHYAAAQVLPEIVKCLINAGADWSVRDQRGDTGLEYALRQKGYYVGMEKYSRCQWTSDHVFEVCQSTVFDELVSYLLRNQTITECDGRAKTLLNGLVYHRIPFNLYSLFKSGLDVNCAYEHFIRYLNQTLFDARRRERDDILEIFKIFRINIQVLCGVPFRQSVLHLRGSYIGKHLKVGNLFKPSVNKNCFPLQRFISNHPKGVEILNECYDKEGYLAIHRAVQGGNTYALSWFIEIGVDITRKTKSGLTILVLAIRMLFDYYHLNEIFGFRNDYILGQILKITKEKNLTHAFCQCNTHHITASRGGGAGNA